MSPVWWHFSLGSVLAGMAILLQSSLSVDLGGCLCVTYPENGTDPFVSWEPGGGSGVVATVHKAAVWDQLPLAAHLPGALRGSVVEDAHPSDTLQPVCLCLEGPHSAPGGYSRQSAFLGIGLEPVPEMTGGWVDRLCLLGLHSS